MSNPWAMYFTVSVPDEFGTVIVRGVDGFDICSFDMEEIRFIDTVPVNVLELEALCKLYREWHKEQETA